MVLFESSLSHRPTRVGRRDTAARFVHDLATAGVPMTLASVKAAADAAASERDVVRHVPVRGAKAQRRPLIRSVGPIVGLS